MKTRGPRRRPHHHKRRPITDVRWQAQFVLRKDDGRAPEFYGHPNVSFHLVVQGRSIEQAIQDAEKQFIQYVSADLRPKFVLQRIESL